MLGKVSLLILNTETTGLRKEDIFDANFSHCWPSEQNYCCFFFLISRVLLFSYANDGLYQSIHAQMSDWVKTAHFASICISKTPEYQTKTPSTNLFKWTTSLIMMKRIQPRPHFQWLAHVDCTCSFVKLVNVGLSPQRMKQSEMYLLRRMLFLAFQIVNTRIWISLLYIRFQIVSYIVLDPLNRTQNLASSSALTIGIWMAF